LSLVDPADVGLERGGFAAELLHEGDDFVGARFVGAIAESDVGAFIREALDDCAADALVAAGNCRHFSFKPIGHLRLPCGHDVIQGFRCAVERIVSKDLCGVEDSRWARKEVAGGLMGDEKPRAAEFAVGSEGLRFGFAFGGAPHHVFERVCKVRGMWGLQATKNGSVEVVEREGLRERAEAIRTDGLAVIGDSSTKCVLCQYHLLSCHSNGRTTPLECGRGSPGLWGI
jgi:hypothetical protein